jgi:hypothetical protein
VRSWERIAKAKRSVVANLFLFVLPLMLLCSLVEGFALTQWGERRGIVVHSVNVSIDLAVRFEVAQLVLGLILLFLGAKMLEWVTESFRLPAGYTQSFTVIAYGYSPIFLARFLAVFPGLNAWICWALGVLGAIYILYHGVALVLQPDQTKGFGLYLMCRLILILFGGSTHLVALAVLHGRIVF